jgi:hypothetical protein
MTKEQIQSLVASYLSKQAEEGPAHESAETPNAEMLEHAMGVGGGEGGEQPHGTGPGGVDVEQLLSQLSPEELQELISMLSAGTAGGGAPPAGNEDVAGLSHEIESHLAQNPEAQVPGASPEKQAALNLVKSAQYIEGFIKQATSYGFAVNDAVTMYDQALTSTVASLNKEAAGPIVPRAAKKGLKDKLKAGYNATKNHLDRNKARYGAAAGAAAGFAMGSRKKNNEKEAAVLALPYGSRKGLKDTLKSGISGVKDHFVKNKGIYGTAAGAVGGFAAGKALNKDEDENEKKSAFVEGVFKQAMARGFSEAEAVSIAQQAATQFND